MAGSLRRVLCPIRCQVRPLLYLVAPATTHRAASYSSEAAGAPGVTSADFTPSFVSWITGHMVSPQSVLDTVLESGETEMNKQRGEG